MRLFTILPIVLWLTLPANGQDKLTERIDALLDQEFTSKPGPGFTVGIIKKGKLVYQGQRGLANLVYRVPFNDSTIFDLASVTKQFTAACIAILQKQARLSVDDDVRKYIPELAFYGDTIRIKHLLNHTSGIRNHNILLELTGFDFKHRGYTNQMIQNLMFRQQGVNNAPSEKMLYSNTNYVLLALIVERVSGQKIQDFAQESLFKPLGMVNTFYISDLEQIIPNSARSHYPTKTGYKQPKSFNLCVGAGGVKSTVVDLAKWMEIFLDSTQDFSYISSFITTLDTLNNGRKMSCARGMFVSPYRGYTTLNHSGRGRGMRAQWICIPVLRLGVVVYANSASINAVDISYKILDQLMEPKAGQVSPKSVTQYRHTKQELSALVGDYQELNSDLLVHILVENDTLKTRSSFGRENIALVSKTKTSFYRQHNPNVSYIFDTSYAVGADLLVDFGGATFYLEKVNLVNAERRSVADFVGKYYSKELEVTYVIQKEGKQLLLSYPQHPRIVLKPRQKDEYGSGRRVKYTFNRDGQGRVQSFYVAAEGTVKHILFERME